MKALGGHEHRSFFCDDISPFFRMWVEQESSREALRVEIYEIRRLAHLLTSRALGSFARNLDPDSEKPHADCVPASPCPKVSK